MSEVIAVAFPERRGASHARAALRVLLDGAVSGGFWGMLLGLVLSVPIAGAVVGAISGFLTMTATLAIDVDDLDPFAGRGAAPLRVGA